jgi:hypothetical protein
MNEEPNLRDPYLNQANNLKRTATLKDRKIID